MPRATQMRDPSTSGFVTLPLAAGERHTPSYLAHTLVLQLLASRGFFLELAAETKGQSHCVVLGSTLDFRVAREGLLEEVTR